MDNGMLTAADVAAVTRNNDDMFGNGSWWIWIILIAFLFPMFNNGWGNNGTVQDTFLADEFIKRDWSETGISAERGSGAQRQTDRSGGTAYGRSL